MITDSTRPSHGASRGRRWFERFEYDPSHTFGFLPGTPPQAGNGPEFVLNIVTCAPVGDRCPRKWSSDLAHRSAVFSPGRRERSGVLALTRSDHVSGLVKLERCVCAQVVTDHWTTSEPYCRSKKRRACAHRDYAACSDLVQVLCSGMDEKMRSLPDDS